MQRLLASCLIAAAGVLCTGIEPALASSLDVVPVMLTLSAQATSGTVMVTNRSNAPVRLHITMFEWAQRPDGEMQLRSTQDVLYFPAMLTLNPNEGRQLRVGTKLKPGAVEKSYRLFIQELPPPVTSSASAKNAVRVLTKMGLPIFVEAAAPKAAPTVASLAQAGAKVTFSINNPGNEHFRVKKVTIHALDGTKTVHTDSIDGWYVLARGTRNFDLVLPDAVCAKTSTVEVEVDSDHGSAKGALAFKRCAQ